MSLDTHVYRKIANSSGHGAVPTTIRRYGVVVQFNIHVRGHFGQVQLAAGHGGIMVSQKLEFWFKMRGQKKV